MTRAGRIAASAERTGRRYRHALPAAARRFSADHCAQLAAAISFHALSSLFPLLIVFLSICALVLHNPDVRADFIAYLLDRFPLSQSAEADLERILSDIPTPASAIGILSIFVLLWSASGMMGALRVALTTVFPQRSGRPYFQSKLVDLALVLAVGLLLFVSFGLTIVVRSVARYTDLLSWLGVGQEVLGAVVPPVLTFIVFIALYRLVPPGRPPLAHLWPGALLAAVGFELVKTGFAFYLATIASYDVVYGSLGTVVAFLFLVYLGASVFLFGAEVAADWPRASDSVAHPAAQPGAPSPWHLRLLRALRGLFVARE